MRLLVAQHGTPGRREMGKRQRVGGSPGRHQEDRDLVLEQLRELMLDALGPVVTAIGERGAFVRPCERGENFGRDPGRVVAGEVHDASFRHPFCRMG